MTDEERERYAAVGQQPQAGAAARARRRCWTCRSSAKRFDQGAAGGRRLLVDDARPARASAWSASPAPARARRRGMICRLIDPSEGEIVFDGQSIGHMPARDFHRSPLPQGHPDRVPGPERQPQPALHRVRLHRPSAAAAGRHARGRCAAPAGRGMRRARRAAGGSAAALSASALRRPEGARRHCARHRLPAAAAGAGRADRGARRLGAGGGAATAGPAAARGRHRACCSSATISTWCA